MLLEQLEKSPENINFKDIIAYIDENYDFTPTKFINGNTTNEANQNNGSCKVFSFAQQKIYQKNKHFNFLGNFTEKMFSKSRRN